MEVLSPGAGWPPIRGVQNFWPTSYLILQQIVTTVMVILHPVSTNVILCFGFPVNLNGGLSCSVFFNFFYLEMAIFSTGPVMIIGHGNDYASLCS